jgi:putative effector of murein hydrolase LrgA (UPF0299 family)
MPVRQDQIGGSMIRFLAFVLTLLVLGETAANLLGAPVPGAAFGLTARLTLIAARGGPDPEMEMLFDGVAPKRPASPLCRV